MKNKYKIRLIFSFISIIILSVLVITRTYAWYVGYAGIRTDVNDIKLSSMGKYYESGEGTKDDPYIITSARHLYNLAWLQDLGYYDENVDSDLSEDGIQPFYFKLGANVDMKTLENDGVVSPIPTIGIDEHPFVGNFDGAGYKIDNLFISTDFTNSNYITPSKFVLDAHEETILNGSIVTKYMGLFGYIGSKTYQKKLDTSITNFTIANERIEVLKDTLVGFICGYADNDLSKIGVANSHFDISKNVNPVNVDINGQEKKYEYLSLYSLVGDYDSDTTGINWQKRPTGGEFGYGGTLDMKKLFDKIGSRGVLAGSAYPIKSVSMDEITPTNSSVTINKYDGSNSKVIETAKTQKAGNNNIGYFVGASTKMYQKSSSSFNFDKFYYPINDNNDATLPYTDYNGVTHNYPTDDVVKYLKDNFSEYIYGARLNETADLNNVLAVEDGIVSGYQGTIIVPTRTIWVAPVEPGTIKFVVYNTDNTNRSFNFKRIKRRIPGNFSTGFESTTTETLLDADGSGGLKKNRFYYYEYEVTKDDINKGYEFIITKGNGDNGCYFLYVDLGTEGTSTSNIGSIVDIDFTYESVDTISGYKEVSSDEGFVLSKVGFTLKYGSVSEVYLYVYRSIQNGNQVYYYYKGDGIELIPMGNPIKKDSINELTN